MSKASIKRLKLEVQELLRMEGVKEFPFFICVFADGTRIPLRDRIQIKKKVLAGDVNFRFIAYLKDGTRIEIKDPDNVARDKVMDWVINETREPEPVFVNKLFEAGLSNTEPTPLPFSDPEQIASTPSEELPKKEEPVEMKDKGLEIIYSGGPVLDLLDEKQWVEIGRVRLFPGSGRNNRGGLEN